MIVSERRPMTPELAILNLVTTQLEGAAIPYMLTGSLAAGYYAEPRMTRDADIVAELSAADAPRLAAMFAHDFGADAETIANAIAHRPVDRRAEGSGPFEIVLGQGFSFGTPDERRQATARRAVGPGPCLYRSMGRAPRRH